jgi:uncharacterized protein YhbP (UPF0306 family)
MSVEEIVRQYLPEVNIMQLATSVNDRPWLCAVHYYTDEQLNFYWISTVDRRHSREIKQNPSVTAYVLVHENTPDENYVIGISVSGTAELIGDNINKEFVEEYRAKLKKDPNALRSMMGGENPLKFYRLKPNKIVLFDNKNFPNNPRQEWNLA